jgi:hypothetical protein
MKLVDDIAAKRLASHGGKFVENIDQAISRDILAGV